MIQAICWVLIHSLWQGLLFTIATGLVMLATVRRSAATRYRWLCVLLCLFLAVCAGTFVYEWRLDRERTMIGDGSALYPTMLQGWLTVMSRYFSANASPIVMTWLIVFAIKCARMTGNLIYAQRIRHYRVAVAPESWQLWMNDWSKRLGIGKKPRLLQSAIVKMPMVTGFWRPVVFVPIGLLTQLPAGEIEAILLHELAHIRRHDWLVNFLQHIAESIFFFNPALLWMSALLRTEREHCCDDLAIAGIDGDKIQYVQALVHFKEYDLKMRGLATCWLKNRDQLVGRVMRIAGEQKKPLNGRERVFFLVSIAVIVLLTLAMGRSGDAAGSGQTAEAGKGLILRDGKMVNLAAFMNKEMKHAVPPPAVLRPAPVKDQKKRDRLRTVKEEAPADPDKLQADGDRTQADKDRMQADWVRMQVDRVRTPVDRDQTQVERERIQADRDHEQAVKDQTQAEIDRQQAIKDREQAVKDREQAIKDREQAERDREQAMKDREQAARDRIQAEIDRRQKDKDRKQQ